MKARFFFFGAVDLDIGDDPAPVIEAPINAAIEQARLHLSRSEALRSATDVQLGPIMEWTPVCRICGCTDDEACPGGCWWKEPDLCSSCDGEPIGSRPPA